MINRFHIFGALLVALAVPAWSQTSTAGTVVGQVVDEQKAAIPGATVKLVDTSTNSAQTTVTNSEGRYVFTPVNPGTYNLTFSKDGFASYQVNTQQVNIGQTLTVA